MCLVFRVLLLRAQELGINNSKRPIWSRVVGEAQMDKWVDGVF